MPGDLLGAIQDGDWRQVKRLLDDGANPDEKNEYNQSAVHAAAVQGNTEIMRLVMDYGATSWDGAMHMAAMYGHIEAMQLLFDRGMKIDEQDVNGNTPLLLAVARGEAEAVRWLLGKNANLDIKNEAGDTALSFCEKLVAGVWLNGRPNETSEIMELLRKATSQKQKLFSARPPRPASP